MTKASGPFEEHTTVVPKKEPEAYLYMIFRMVSGAR